MNPYILVSVGAVFISSAAQMALKYSARKKYSLWLYEYLNIWVIGGYCILMGALLLNVYSLNHGLELKTLLAIEALGYLFVPMLSFFIFRERIGIRKIFAVMLIICGIIIFFI